jgi:hypothetical protein
MKKILLTALIAIGFLATTNVQAQETDTTGPNFPKIDASPLDLVVYRNDNDEAVARVIYSRPKKRNREIFGKLVPFGQVWRTGANEATELTFYKDMKIGNETVKKGTYTLYTIPEEKEWTIILNNKTMTWGAYEYTDEEDIVRIKVPVRTTPTPVEHFSMAFENTPEGANLLIGWDTSYVKVPFKE